MSSCSHWNLPNELTLRILSKLPFQDLISFAMSNKQLYKVYSLNKEYIFYTKLQNEYPCNTYQHTYKLYFNQQKNRQEENIHITRIDQIQCEYKSGVHLLRTVFIGGIFVHLLLAVSCIGNKR
jgi:adenine specific DNA methylase Mod